MPTLTACYWILNHASSLCASPHKTAHKKKISCPRKTKASEYIYIYIYLYLYVYFYTQRSYFFIISLCAEMNATTYKVPIEANRCNIGEPRVVFLGTLLAHFHPCLVYVLYEIYPYVKWSFEETFYPSFCCFWEVLFIDFQIDLFQAIATATHLPILLV